MKKKILSAVLLASLINSCGEQDTQKQQKGENDVDAATMFIRSALDGRWKDAKKLIVHDSANVQDLDVAEQNYTQRMNVTDQRGYREAQITVHDTRKIDDSTSVVVYSNTYKKKQDSVRVVRMANQWLVDLKYSFPHDHANEQ